MVLTRRGARAITEAQQAGVTDATTTNSDDVRASTDMDAEIDDSGKLQAQQHHIRTSIAWRLWIGHVIAILTVSALVHAALQPAETPLLWHALVLLLCAISLRTVLAFSVHSLRAPAVRPGIFLALSAASLFASNALHVLATRALPRYVLGFMAAAALDVTAAWLKMTVSAKHPTTEPFVLPISMVYTAADIYLAAVVARQDAIVGRFVWFMGVRFIINLFVTVNYSMAIVQSDEMKKKAAVSGSPPR